MDSFRFDDLEVVLPQEEGLGSFAFEFLRYDDLELIL